MTATAKLFKAGNSQAVRLPKAFRMPGQEVWINKNPVTGEITLKPKANKQSLEAFFDLLDKVKMPKDYLAKRSDAGQKPRNPYADWKD